MGGFGSTRWEWERTRQATDPLLWLDVRLLARQGALDPGTYYSTSWNRRGEPAGTVSHLADADRLTLIYSTKGPAEAEWQPVRERVWLDRTPCNYGGSRPWFLCPGCGRRRAVLYSVGGHFRCRACHDLAYSSTREEAWDRAMRRADTLRLRIGGRRGMHQWPPKPKGMHWDRYERIMAEIQERDRAALLLFSADLDKLQRDIERRFP